MLAEVDGQLVPIPINRTTLNTLYGLDLQTDEEAAAFLASRAEPVDEIRTSEDVVVSAVGRELYETFFRGYTRKQWGLDPSRARQVGDRARADPHQHRRPLFHRQLPGHAGATATPRMFEQMLDHPNIDVMLGVDFADVRDEVDARPARSSPARSTSISAIRFGKLPYR